MAREEADLQAPGLMSLRERLAATEVRTEQGGPALVHHATFSRFPVSAIAPLSHFGTRAAARERMGGWHGDVPDGVRLISAFLDLRNPLWLSDLNDVHDVRRLLNLIAFSEADKAFDDALRARILDHEQQTGEGMEMLAICLREVGYDGIAYRNLHEDPGSISWVPTGPDQIVVVADGLLSESRDPWDIDVDSWIGSSNPGRPCGAEGRPPCPCHVGHRIPEAGREAPAIEVDTEGREARWIPDPHLPDGTMGLYSPEGHFEGALVGGRIRVAPGLRGHAGAELMIMASAEILGRSPAVGVSLTASERSAYLSARRILHARAAQEGRLDAGLDGDPVSPPGP